MKMIYIKISKYIYQTLLKAFRVNLYFTFAKKKNTKHIKQRITVYTLT